MVEQNPVDFLVDRFGMTRLDMTVKYGFGANHLLLAAQGRKDSLGPTLLSAFDMEAAEHGLSVDALIQERYGAPDLSTAWENWKREKRAGTMFVADIPPAPESLSPWARIVGQVGSVAKTAQLLRVRDLVISRYLDKPTMPSSLREALEDTGWAGVVALDAEQKQYFRV